MALSIIFVIGLAVGYVARRYGFCIFGVLVELLTLGSGKRILAVLSAMLVFGLVQFGSYEHGVEHAGLKYLAGGLLQGIGYYLAMGCPLSLIVRIGEGSKFHMVVFVSFVVGVALYVGLLESLVSRTLGAVSFTKAVTLVDLF
ncbi:MAG: YeeE/YedE thiosulfate transporter family protein [Planctomycetota bacterium]|jgi:uncharacterized membrane protein YedE/YeeE